MSSIHDAVAYAPSLVQPSARCSHRYELTSYGLRIHGHLTSSADKLHGSMLCEMLLFRHPSLAQRLDVSCRLAAAMLSAAGWRVRHSMPSSVTFSPRRCHNLKLSTFTGLRQRCILRTFPWHQCVANPWGQLAASLYLTRLRKYDCVSGLEPASLEVAVWHMLTATAGRAG